MQVNLACHIFSHPTAAALKTGVAEKQLPIEALDTSFLLRL